MAANPTPVIGYTIQFTVATAKIVHATDNNAQPNKYTSSPTLTEDDLVELCREVVQKAAEAYQNGQRTFDLLIDERGYILRGSSFSLSAAPAAFAPAGSRAATAAQPTTRERKRPKRKPTAAKRKRTSTVRKKKKRKS